MEEIEVFNKEQYLLERLALLGITEQENSFEVFNPDAEFPQKTTSLMPIFSADDKGNIKILVYNIDGQLINYVHQGDGAMSHVNAKVKQFYITRLREPKADAKGNIMKYQIPKGHGTFPFFHPLLVDAYKNKTKIEVLYITEGYFKAYKACKHNLHCVGLSSITHMKDKSGKLHADIKRLIQACEVKKVVWLTDGDCINLSSKEINDDLDLYKRPNGFFSSIQQFKNLLDEYENIEKWFAHIKSESLPQKPKGLDDLYVANEFEAESRNKGDEEVTFEALNFSGGNKFFYMDNITFNVAKVSRYFKLHNVNEFYLYHSEHRADLRNREFIFHGTKYKYNEEKGECEVIIPADASNYFRVGDQYHAKIMIPNKYNQLEHTFHRRQKGTIMDDHGKNIIKHIPKYHAFAVVPDHINYQSVLHGCYNLYFPFEWAPDEGEFPATMKFLTHLFGNDTVSWINPKTKEVVEYREIDLGLDYIQLLYQKPTQILPILCLVSRENNTGKSTMAKWLRMLFTQNAAIVGNADLANDFNASWASKLLIICDEAKIDKQTVIEKVKALSTADKIFMNAKGKDQVEIDFFGKFIFITNNEDNFIYASEDDVRYWVRKVPVITELNVNLLQDLQDEIPAFLNFLNHRKIVTEQRHRAWFDPELIKTEALRKVINFSMPTIEKELRTKLKDMFLDFAPDEIMMTKKAIEERFFKGKYETNYIDKILEKIGVEQYHEWVYNDLKFKTLEDIKAHDSKADLTKAEKQYKVHRHSYPVWQNEGGEMKRVDIKDIGRPYIFKAEKFLTPDEILKMSKDDENALANQLAKQGEITPF